MKCIKNYSVSFDNQDRLNKGQKLMVDSSRLVRIHSVGMRNNAILFDQSIIRK
jgi:hypothetical protein